MAEIGVGIIGFGLATKVFHAPFVSAVPGLRLVSILQRSGSAAAEAYPAAKVVRSVAELMADAAVDLVVVATPNDTHVAMAMEALNAGKHVVIDKPFAPTSAEAAELLALAQQKGVLLCPFHNRRWDGDFLTVKKLLAEGTLGRVVTIESHFDRYRPLLREDTWKDSAGAAQGLLMDLGPHLVDQAVALYGMPITLTASVRRDRDDQRLEDAFDIALGYEVQGRGLVYWCRSSMLACENSPRFLVHGVGGSFRKYGLDPQEPAVIAGAKVPRMGSDEVWLREDEAMWGTLKVAPELNEPGGLVRSAVETELGDYRGFYANVRDAVHGTAALAVPGWAGFEVIRLLELARLSCAEGRTLTVSRVQDRKN